MRDRDNFREHINYITEQKEDLRNKIKLLTMGDISYDRFVGNHHKISGLISIVENLFVNIEREQAEEIVKEFTENFHGKIEWFKNYKPSTKHLDDDMLVENFLEIEEWLKRKWDEIK